MPAAGSLCPGLPAGGEGRSGGYRVGGGKLPLPLRLHPTECPSLNPTVSKPLSLLGLTADPRGLELELSSFSCPQLSQGGSAGHSSMRQGPSTQESELPASSCPLLSVPMCG